MTQPINEPIVLLDVEDIAPCGVFGPDPDERHPEPTPPQEVTP